MSQNPACRGLTHTWLTHTMLTDTKIRALKAREKVYRLADANGLCIEVRPNGTKVWRYRYRHHGKASMVTLGQYPTTTLQAARTERDRLRAIVQAGSNPALVARLERQALATRAVNTFGAIAAELLEKRLREGMTTGSVVRERRLAEKDLADLSDVLVHDVTAPMLLMALRKIEARGVIETAHRARSLAGRVFRYAIATGRADRNPAADLVGALEQPKVQHFPALTDPDEVAQLLRSLHSYAGEPATIAALKLAPMLFVRPGELRQMEWADVNLEAAEWRFTASKTAQDHIVPLATQAVGILTELHPLTSRSMYVFPGARSSKRPMSENTINAALRNLGYDRETMTGHGFRAMARTILDEVLGFRPDFIEHQLAHAVRDPLGRAYNRATHLPERRKMMQVWADYLDKLRAGAQVHQLASRTKAG